MKGFGRVFQATCKAVGRVGRSTLVGYILGHG